MSWPELISQEILIGLPGNEIGFLYTVKFGGLTIRRGFVPTMPAESSARQTRFAWTDRSERDVVDEDERDAG